jgi:hypothetical protein
MLLSCSRAKERLGRAPLVVLSRVYSLSKSDPGRPASIVGLGCNRS